MERNGLNLSMAFSATLIPGLTPWRALFASLSCKQYQIAVSDCQIESGAIRKNCQLNQLFGA
jgi:hypothetical protein